MVVEDRYSAVFALNRVRPSVIADALGEASVRYPNVPIVFCEKRRSPRSGRTGSWERLWPSRRSTCSSRPMAARPERVMAHLGVDPSDVALVGQEMPPVHRPKPAAGRWSI